MEDKYKLILVAGARPNFMKIAPLIKELKSNEHITYKLVHTGQHYDANMSGVFFNQFNMPTPDINLDVGSCSHAKQTALIMEKFEKVCIDEKPDMVLVVGDVNSTMACSLVASKMDIKTAHYEAGLRSNDRTMPEEINRIVTDSICDYFFTTCKDATDNLTREGKTDNIFLVGNLMIDTLIELQEKTSNMLTGKYILVTLHRPSNVDNMETLHSIIDVLHNVSRKMPVIFPMHPRTHKQFQKQQYEHNENLYCVDPVGYIEFLGYQNNATAVITDSGGIQEETTFLGIPCLTLRDNTERPITITEGTNKLIKIDEIEYEIDEILNGNSKKGTIPYLWDGNTAKRIIKIIDDVSRGVY